MSTNKRGPRRQLGNVYAVESGGTNLWLVSLQDSSYGVMLRNPTGEVSRTDFLETYAVFDTAIKSKAWQLVGRVGFRSEEDQWPNPCRFHEYSDPKGMFVYYRGAQELADFDVSKLKVAQIYKPEQFLSAIKERLDSLKSTQ